MLTAVAFYGYQVFIPTSPERLTYLAAYVAIGLLLMSYFGWLVHGYVVLREWSFRIPRSRNVDLTNGRAPEVTDEDESAIAKFLKWL